MYTTSHQRLCAIHRRRAPETIPIATVALALGGRFNPATYAAAARWIPSRCIDPAPECYVGLPASAQPTSGAVFFHLTWQWT